MLAAHLLNNLRAGRGNSWLGQAKRRLGKMSLLNQESGSADPGGRLRYGRGIMGGGRGARSRSPKLRGELAPTTGSAPTSPAQVKVWNLKKVHQGGDTVLLRIE